MRIDFFRTHAGLVAAFLGGWLAFAALLVARDAFFARDGLSWARHVLPTLFILAPWVVVSLVLGVFRQRIAYRWQGVRRSAVHVILATGVGLAHIGWMAWRFWVFYPDMVQSVSPGYVYAEQFLQWMPFEYIVYGLCVLAWGSTADVGPAEVTSRVLALRAQSGTVQLPYDDIIWVRADGNYVEVCTTEEVVRTRATLDALLADLPASAFLQTHRSAVVNAGHVRQLEASRALLSNGDRAPVSRRRRQALQSRLAPL